MGVTFTVDGSTVGTVRLESVELVDAAENGNVGTGRFTIDDSAGTLATTGHKTITVEEDDCATTLTASGFVGTRTITRGTHRTLAGRDVQVEMVDLNDLLNRRTLHVTGNRGRESIGDRLTWLLADSHLAGLVADNGFVVYPSTMMDKNDYRTMKPGDVLADCATRVNYNYFVYPDPTTGDASLWFADSNTSTSYSSSLRLSNVLSDIDWTTTFPVSPSATLSRNPDSVYSGVHLSYAGGRVFRHRAATASAFVERDTVGPSSSVKRRARAIALANNYLNVHKTEEDIIEDTVLVTSSSVNLIKAGMRVQVRYSDMDPEGYSSFSWFRVLERRVRPVVSPGGIPEAPDEPLYELSLRLSPQEGNVIAECEPTDLNFTYGTVTIGDRYICRYLFIGIGGPCGPDDGGYFQWNGKGDGLPSNVNDGDETTGCSVPAGVLGGDLTVVLNSDLGSEMTVTSYQWTAFPADPLNVFRYSDDGSAWTTIPGAYGFQDGAQAWIFDAPITARYWQIGGASVNSTPGWQGVIQTWRIMGCP